jgi:hypothetical protein
MPMKNDFEILLSLLYADWFILPMVIIMMLCIAGLLRRIIYNPKRFYALLLVSVAAILFSFYYILPVPINVQKDEIKFIHALIDNNENATTSHLKNTLAVECANSSYLHGYQYFKVIKAFRADFDATIDRQKFVLLGSTDNQKKFPESKLCELKL